MKGHRQSGFSLLEILVALALVTVVLTMVVGNSFSSRRNLDQLMGDVERAVRFSTDEASLKNRFVRISFDLESEEQGMKIEYSDDPNLVIDPNPVKKSIRKKKKKRDYFTPVEDYEEEDFTFPMGVRIIAVGTNLTRELRIDGKPQIFFYPTGEKDSAIIIFATDEEVSYLEINPFQQVIDRNYIVFDEEISDDNYTEKMLEMAEEVYKQWLAK